MAYYIKVTKKVADQMGLTELRNRTADGGVILWQSDIAKYEGATLFERIETVGGVALTPLQAKHEIDGTVGMYFKPFTPELFGGDELEESESEDTNIENSMEDKL